MEDLNKLKPPTSFQTKLFINGEFVDGVKKQTLPVINPATEEKICEISIATEEDVDLAIAAAEKAYPIWKNMGPAARAKCIFKLADLVESNINDFIALESLDNGKPLGEASADITEVVANLRYMAGWCDKVTGKTFTLNKENELYMSLREPFGVVGLISPWNFPLLMCEWKFGPALAAGNCVVHKPSEITPLTILKLATLLNEAGFPKGVYNIIPGKRISESHKIKKISFTGSTVIGRTILEASSKSNLKKVTLELGGKSPVIICPDADLDKAAGLAWATIMYNVGQCCIAGSRCFPHESIYDAFLEKLKTFAAGIKQGNAFEGANFGPLVNKTQLDKVLGYIKEGKEVEKLNCVIGGERNGDKGYFVKPTIFANVPTESKLASDEIFGPVLCVMKPWKTVEEVIERANDTRYGLASLIISNNPKTIHQISNSIQSGTVFVNCYCIPGKEVPFGGYKESGFGRDNGEEAILEYTQLKTVYHNYN